jgi:orotate phosphoribosyltransferase
MNSIDIFKLLIKIEAIKISTDEPFTFSSGISSPIYCDNRVLISAPNERNQIIDAMLTQIEPLIATTDVIAGTATAGIPHAAWLADRLDKPMVYVRSKPKAHGQKNQIEGKLKAGQRVLVIEDLISTGNSVINAVRALREAGAVVNHCLSILNYGFNTTAETFSDAKLEIINLANFSEALSHPNLFHPNQRLILEQWQSNPNGWQK